MLLYSHHLAGKSLITLLAIAIARKKILLDTKYMSKKGDESNTYAML